MKVGSNQIQAFTYYYLDDFELYSKSTLIDYYMKCIKAEGEK